MKLPANLTPDQIVSAAEEAMTGLENPGFCMSCGEQNDGCEPDMRRGECEHCGEQQVYGAEELCMMLV